MSSTPEEHDLPQSGTPADTDPETATTDDGSLASTSTADGAGEANLEQVDEPYVPRSPADPDALVEGGRVGTARDME